MKKVLFSLFAGLLALLLIVPLFLPNEFTVERSIHIQTERSPIFSRIVDLQSWKDWSPWYAQEPDADYSFEGTPGVVGSSSQWKGEKIGAGKQTLTKIVQPEYVETKLEFFEPENSQATGYWKFNEENGCTTVVWGIKGELGYPIGRIMGCFMDKMIGSDFEKGLSSLKNVMEAK